MLWEKNKTLVTSIFSFSQVFYPTQIKFQFLSHIFFFSKFYQFRQVTFILSSANTFNLEKSHLFCLLQILSIKTVTFISSSANSFNFDKSEILLFGEGYYRVMSYCITETRDNPLLKEHDRLYRTTNIHKKVFYVSLFQKRNL